MNVLPFYEDGVSAGFPSPAEDYLHKPLDLHEHLVKHPASTFFIKVKGDSMQGGGIFSGDLLIVDRSIPAADRHIVVALLNGEFTVKRLVIKHEGVYLAAEHPSYPPIAISKEDDFQVWGVVTYVIHRTC